MKGYTEYIALGAMSGTSLDGLDLCLAKFVQKQPTWEYQILASKTINYDKQTLDKLRNAHLLKAEELVKFHYDYGSWIGGHAKKLIDEINVVPNIIASHGHTVFHNPQNGYTLQIGKGSAISAITGIPCISDFRSTDICLGGQGAPLVPIGDELLFGNYDLCLNLGGIANISYKNKNNSKRTAYDICPCNMVLNFLSNKLGKTYDKNGEMGKTGTTIPKLLDATNNIEYYNLPSPKSLSREWFEQNFIPLINNEEYKIESLLRTTYEHISAQIASVAKTTKGENMLITGGGAHNKFLVELIRDKTSCNVFVPEQNIVDFKEALVFALLGVLHVTRQTSVLASATGAKHNSIGGCMYL